MRKFFFSAALAALFLFPVTLPANDRTTDPENYWLSVADVVDSEAFLPEPPASESAHFAYDREQYEWGKSVRDSLRGRQAVIDADLSDGWLDRAFSEAFGFRLTPDNAPQTVKLINKMKEDAGDLATRSAKVHYKRPRPFMVFDEPSATPSHEAALRENGSFPSGHTSIGWATALVLAELNPDRNLEIMKRGYEFGQSRVICGVHFQSDVDAGRLTGAAVVAALHADPAFRKQLDKARKEVRKLRKAKGS